MKHRSIAVIGAGAWGTALALHLGRGDRTIPLWSRTPITREADGANARLPGFPLPTNIQPTTTFPDADILLVTTPVQHLRGVLEQMTPRAAMVLCCKGMERETGALPLEIAVQVHPNLARAVLSGPNFAHEIAAELPAAAVLAADDPDLAAELAHEISDPAFRIYPSVDPIGVQIGGAAKNVIAIAAGVCLGAGLGENARAALITRGIAEMGRLAQALGGRPETLSGLSGVGDLILTCTGASSRNFSLGHELGRGMSLNDILAQRRSVAEGVETAPALLAVAHQHVVDTPIIETVTHLLAGRLTPHEARIALMSRPTRAE